MSGEETSDDEIGGIPDAFAIGHPDGNRLLNRLGGVSHTFLWIPRMFRFSFKLNIRPSFLWWRREFHVLGNNVPLRGHTRLTCGAGGRHISGWA